MRRCGTTNAAPRLAAGPLPPVARARYDAVSAIGSRRSVCSAQTAWIGSPGTPAALAGAAQGGVRVGRDGPRWDCNHIDLPLGTGPTNTTRAGEPKRTRYVVA